MGGVYRLNRFNRGVCWFSILAGCVAIIGVTSYGLVVVHRLAVGSRPGKEAISLLALFFCLVFGIAFGCTIAGAKKMLRYAVEVTDEGVRTPECFLRWLDIQAVEHPERVFGLAFQISARDGMRIPIYPVTGARELEQSVLDAVSQRAEPQDGASVVTYRTAGRWRKALLSTMAVAGCLVAAVFFALVYVFAASGRLSPSRAGLILALLVSLAGSKCMLDYLGSVLRTEVALCGDGIRVGDHSARWDEIGWIEHSDLPWVAFCLSRRSGQRMSIFSSLENIEQFRNAIEARLASGK